MKSALRPSVLWSLGQVKMRRAVLRKLRPQTPRIKPISWLRRSADRLHWEADYSLRRLSALLTIRLMTAPSGWPMPIPLPWYSPTLRSFSLAKLSRSAWGITSGPLWASISRILPRDLPAETILVNTQCSFRLSDSKFRSNLKDRGVILQWDFQVERSLRKLARTLGTPTVPAQLEMEKAFVR